MRTTYQAYMREVTPSEEFCFALEGRMKRALYAPKQRRTSRYVAAAIAVIVLFAAGMAVIMNRPGTEDNAARFAPVAGENSADDGVDAAAFTADEMTEPAASNSDGTGAVPAKGIWIDTSEKALRDAENSIAVQMLKEDYSADRSYIGVDAVIHFSANNRDYELYHVLDTGSGAFTLSTNGIEPYPYNTFGGEENAEAEAFFEAEDAAKDAYFVYMRVPAVNE